METIEEIHSRGSLLAYVIRAEWLPEQTTFITADEADFQLGCFVYGAGGEAARHEHREVTRSVRGTNEFVLVRKGRCEVDLYDDNRELVRTLELRAGDAVLMVSGGHGFRLPEDTVLLSIKQGPYSGLSEKERF